MPELLGYARVSTTEQNADLQRAALTQAACWKVFTDHVTGTRERRPELDRLLEQVRPGDTLVVWRLDRLGRSLRHLIDVATELGGGGVPIVDREHRHHHRGRPVIFHVFGPSSSASSSWNAPGRGRRRRGRAAGWVALRR